MDIRRMILLIESFHRIDWLTIDPAQVAISAQTWEHRSGMGDGDGGSTVDADDVAKAQIRFRALAHGPMTLYRAMSCSPYSLDHGDSLGLAWTLDPTYAIPYNAGRSRGRSGTLVFTALVQPDAVDWLASIALSNGGEQEIRLLDHKTIKLIKIVDMFDDEVRPELWGGEFRTGPIV